MTIQFEPDNGHRADSRAVSMSNLDARRYFFHKADERWLEWLWRNGFLDAIKDGKREPQCDQNTRT